MTPVWGSDAIVSLKVAEEYYPVFCATDMLLTVRQDVVLATSASTGIYRLKRLRGLTEWSVTVSGLTKLDNTDGQISFFYLVQELVRGSELDIRIEFTDDEDNDQTLSGTVIIPEMSISGPAEDWSQANITFEGTGGFSMEPVPPPAETECEVQDTIYTTLAEGAVYVENALLQEEGVVIITVARSGITLSESEVDPIGMEFRFDDATGRIYVDAENPGNPGGEEFVIVYKIDTTESG